MKSFQLLSGNKIPAVGLGTCIADLNLGKSNGNQVVDLVATAIRKGYRHIDTAAVCKYEFHISR